MAFGKNKDRGGKNLDVPDDDERGVEHSDDVDGPFGIEDFDSVAVAKKGRHDLGSVLIPENETSELAVELNQAGVPTTVWMVTPNGRYNVTAYAAPKAGSLWREIVTELAESLRNDGAQVSIEDGRWGREVVGLMTKGPEPLAMRFIGVDGYRWMVRGAAISPPERADALAQEVRHALSDTVVRRGDEPQPARAQLPLQLSEGLVQRLRQRAEQMAQQNGPTRHNPHPQQVMSPPPGSAQQAQPALQSRPFMQPPEQQANESEAQEPDPIPTPRPAARRSEQGSAMQQLRTITGG